MNQVAATAPRISGARAPSRERKIELHLGLFFLLAIWTPFEDLGYPRFAEPLRYVLYLAAALSYVARGNNDDWRRLASRPIAYALFAFVAFCIASSAWSENIILSLPRALLLALTVAVCAQAVVRIGAYRVARTLAASLGLFVGLGVLAAVVLPGIGTEASAEHLGKWRGLSGQKNGFGFLCVILSLLLLALAPARSSASSLVIRGVGLLVSLTGVAMSGSRGALLSLIVGGALIAWSSVPGSRNRLLVLILTPAIVMLLVAVASVFTLPSDALFGVEIDDNSRSVIWAFGLDELTGGREFVGFGFGGFWTDARQLQFWQANGWVLPNFHNGYVSILVETGIIGSTTFYLAVILAASSALRNILLPRGPATTALAVVSIVCIAQNVFENTFSRSTDIGLIVFLCASLALWLEPARAPALEPTAGTSR